MSQLLFLHAILLKYDKILCNSVSFYVAGFNEEELLRIWKGLYYCMWMSDKMIVQEDLADKLSEMMHCFKTPEQGKVELKDRV